MVIGAGRLGSIIRVFCYTGKKFLFKTILIIFLNNILYNLLKTDKT